MKPEKTNDRFDENKAEVDVISNGNGSNVVDVRIKENGKTTIVNDVIVYTQEQIEKTEAIMEKERKELEADLG